MEQEIREEREEMERPEEATVSEMCVRCDRCVCRVSTVDVDYNDDEVLVRGWALTMAAINKEREMMGEEEGAAIVKAQPRTSTSSSL
jgi:hypothetical protein